MKKLYAVSILCLAAFFTIKAQQINWQYYSPGTGGGLDEAFTITQTHDTGYIFAGRTGSVGINAADFYIVKLNSAGVSQWSKTYSGQYIDEARAIRQMADGTYIMTGVTVDFPDTSIGISNQDDMILMKLDANGDTIWVKHFGGPGVDTGDALDTTSDGGFIVVGRYGFTSSDNDFYLVRTDANGDTLWTKIYGGSGFDIARAVKSTPDNGFIIAGTTTSYGVNAVSGNIWLMKTNSSGDTLWTRVIGGPNEEEGYSVNLTNDGGYILTGSTGNNSTDSADIYIVKTDSLGNTQWTQTYGPPYNDLGRDIIQTSDGGYALAGINFTTLGAAPPMMYVLKADSLGEKEWDTLLGNYNSPNGAKGYCIQQTLDGGYVVAGENDLGNGSLDNRAYIVKFAGPPVSAGIPQINTSLSCPVYPNPFDTKTTIVLPDNMPGPAMLRIYNTTGQLMVSREIGDNNQQAVVNKAELSEGVYFYEITSSSSPVNYRGKLVVR